MHAKSMVPTTQSDPGGAESACGRRPTIGTAPYENWRPPLLWTAVLVLVEPDDLLLNDATGQGSLLLLPGGPVSDGQAPMDAARHALLGAEKGLPIARHVATDKTQLRRRQVTVHIFASSLLSRREATVLRPLDARAITRIVPIDHAIPLLPPRARTRAETGLAALTTSGTANSSPTYLLTNG
jgi:hypothetical protein